MLNDTDIIDLTNLTLKELGRMKFNQIATRLQEYHMMGKMLKDEKQEFEGGTGIQRTIMVDHSGAARMVGMFQTDTVNVADQTVLMSIPWKHTTTNYAYERREMLMNKGAAKIVDLLKVRRADAMISLAETLETQGWSKPSDSNDVANAFGVKYWIVKNATAGFNGGNPSGFTSGAGAVSSTTVTRWANYTAPYTSVSKPDLIDAMRTAARKIVFKSPISIDDFRRGAGDTYRIYTNEATLKAMESVGEAQNENLGRDLASMDGTLTFRKNPIFWVPKLDADTDNPVYMINWAWFNPVFLSGDYMRETSPSLAANQHNVFVVHVDLTWNMLCTNRRAQAVLSNGVAVTQ